MESTYQENPCLGAIHLVPKIKRTTENLWQGRYIRKDCPVPQVIIASW